MSPKPISRHRQSLCRFNRPSASCASFALASVPCCACLRCISWTTEHDRRHALLRNYLNASVPDNHKVAEALWFVLERFVRVAYPDHFAPGDTLGKFVNLCQQRIGKPEQILDAARTQELDDILGYANRFRHETNRAYETEAGNDGAIVGFVRRTLAFTRH
jgi:hypothetical protein